MVRKADTKDVLLGRLRGILEAWSGEGPLPRRERRRVSRLLEALWRCRLFVAEQRRLELCGIWLARADRPDPWLRELWLLDIRAWQRYLSLAGTGQDRPQRVEDPRPNYDYIRPLPLYPRMFV